MRTSEDIGAGLLPARDARAIERGERIHVVGAGGAGASAAAMLAAAARASVSGCDRGGTSPYTAAVEAAGIPLAWEHSASHVAAALGGGAILADRLAVTKALTSIEPGHPELAAARAHGVPLEAWQQVIADAATTHGGVLVGVAGTHGKSTTAGWLVHALDVAGRDPSGFVGALIPGRAGGPASTARWGGGDVFVVEADEYAGNFDPYRPDICLLLNAEWDHPDVFADEDAVVEAFATWVESARRRRRHVGLVANVGDRGVRRVVERLGGTDVEIVACRLGPPEYGILTGEIVARSDAGTTVRVSGRPLDTPLDVRLALPGDHVAANGLVVAATSLRLGVARDELRRGLETFRGVGRRLELKGEVGGVVVIDDYGHHPTAIAATMSAVRQRYPGRRLWTVYEPLTFHRTAAMLDAFADVLADADEAVVADIWAGRDPDTTITSADTLARTIARHGRAAAAAPGSVERTADHLAARVRPGDVVLVMGGGRSYVIAERLVELLAEGSAVDR